MATAAATCDSRKGKKNAEVLDFDEYHSCVFFPKWDKNSGWGEDFHTRVRRFINKLDKMNAAREYLSGTVLMELKEIMENIKRARHHQRKQKS